MATIRKRTIKDGGGWQVLVRLKGHPAQVATFERKTDAVRWAENTQAAIREGRHFKTVESRKHTFGDMIDRYVKEVLPSKAQNSRHSQGPQLEWWKERLGAYTLGNVTAAMIAEAKDTLAAGTTRFKKQRASSTVIRFLAALSHCYTVAIKEWGWTEDNPCKRVTKPKEGKGRVRYLDKDQDELNRLLDACKKSRCKLLHDVVILALTTGGRQSEIMGLTWADVSIERGTLTFRDTKNGEDHVVPIVGPAVPIMAARAKVRRLDTPYVFPAPFRRGREPRPLDIKNAWLGAVERAGIPDFHFHDLRHTCASYLAMNGASLAEIAEVLNHKTLAMVRRYAHLSEAHTKRVVSSMAAVMFAEPEQNQSEQKPQG